MKKMINTFQYYDWGSKNALTCLYGVTNPNNRTIAELWMGAYQKNSSRIQDEKGNKISLREFISQDLSNSLGFSVAKRFGELPFLCKVLCVNKPLSIQVHPSLNAAREGFIKENQKGISLNAPNRNYKDVNHKPELIFALTPFKAMNGFRTLSSIVQLLQPVSRAHPSIANFLTQPDERYLKKLFFDLLMMNNQEKSLALDILNNAISQQCGEPWQTIAMVAKIHPNDSGLFLLLILNLITLERGEAMFICTETLHSYIKGVALEIMANSDNVLRAALTTKHTDISELIANTKFVSQDENTLLVLPIKKAESLFFPVPTSDFSFSVHNLQPTPEILTGSSAAIFFCISGFATLCSSNQQCVAHPGVSVFVPAKDFPVVIQGKGSLAQIYNKS